MSSCKGLADLHPLPSIFAAQALLSHILNDGVHDKKPASQFYFTLRTIQQHLDKAAKASDVLLPSIGEDNVTLEYVNL